MGELDSATQAYERALHFNQNSIPAMVAISCILRSKDQFPAAVEYLQSILRIDSSNGETWSSLGMHNLYDPYTTQADSEDRTLLLNDGRSPESLLRIPTGSLPSAESQGRP